MAASADMPDDAGSGAPEIERRVAMLEKMVDREIMKRPAGKPFRTLLSGGEETRAAAELLLERYARAGWSGGRVEPADHGGFWLILEP